MFRTVQIFIKSLNVVARSENPKIADVFVRKGAFLKMYTEYIRDFESMVALLDDNRQKNPAFDKVVFNFEVC